MRQYFKHVYVNALKDSKLNIFNCGYTDLFSISNQWNFERVSLPYWCLYWNKQPGAVITFDQHRIALKPSLILLIAPHTVFSTSNQSHVGHFYIHFQIITPHISIKPQVYIIPAISYLKTLLRNNIAIMRRSESAGWRFSLLSRAIVELALSRIVDHALYLPVIDRHIQAAISYLETNLGAEISNATLAQQSGLSLSAFMDLFKKQLGHSPHNYLNLKRIEKACLMLHYDNEASIKQIAEETGFCDRYHFSRVFKRCQGVSPAKFRRQNFNPLK